MKYSTILFDFDGTLADSTQAIIPCVFYTYEKMGLEPPDISHMHRFIGPPLHDSFKMIGMDEENIDRAVALYREFFNKTNAWDITLYDGIERLLEGLKNAGVQMAVTSIRVENKLQVVCDRMGLGRFFNVVCGRVEEENVLSKADVVHRAQKLLGDPAGKTLLIGDSKYDEEGADEVDIDFVAALYGFGFESRDEVEKSVFIAETVNDLSAFLLKTLD